MVKKINKITSFFLVGILLVFFVNTLFARGPNQSNNNLALYKGWQMTQRITRTMSNIGNWAYWITYDGMSAHDPIADASGGIYPRGTAAAIYQDGFVWGGYVRDGETPALRVGGQTYAIGTAPGWITAGGTAVDPNNSRVSIYRIRSDWRTLTPAQVRQDAAEVNSKSIGAVSEAEVEAVLQQYEDSWNNWPVDLGAPWVDNNNNGTYEPDEDVAGIANADQVVWFVVNDLDASRTHDLYGSPPMGMELQITMWQYKQPGAALGQLLFKKYKLINKSGARIDSMFVAQWSDPDLGNYSDDLVGCDTVLSLGYAYNGYASDDQYSPFGLAPPSAGYDFFQGPIIETGNSADTAIFDLKKVSGAINLPMTSFSWFAAGSDISDPDLGDYDGTKQWYNMLNGFIPNTNLTNPSPYHIGSGPGSGDTWDAGDPTKFPLAGDPVTDAGDLDAHGNNFPPGDRRLVLSSGPFTMQDGDTQEVVLSVVGGIGDDNVLSVDQLKKTDAVAQQLYNDLFKTVPKPPASPNVNVFTYPQKVVLEWGSDQERVAETESYNPLTGYDFQGYNVYQLPSESATLAQAHRITTYDVIDGVDVIYGNRFVSQFGGSGTVPIQQGANTGIKRFIEISKDYISDDVLRPGREYYFAITAYNYNPDPTLIEDKALESSLNIITVVPQPPNPGTRFPNQFGDVLSVDHPAGESDGIVQAKVVDPSAFTGDSYEVFFKEFQYLTIDILTQIDSIAALDTTYIAGFDSLGNVIITDTLITYDTTYVQVADSLTHTALGWNVRKSGATKPIVENQFQASTIAERDDQPIFDGIQVKVSGPPVGINTTVPGPYGDLQPYNGWNWTGTRWVSWTNWGGASFGGAMDIGANFFGSTITDPTTYMDVEIRFAGDTQANEPDRWSKVSVYRRDLGYAYDGIGDAPFAAWDTENNRRLNVCIVEDANAGNANKQWDMGWDGSSFASLGGREYVFIMNSDYDPVTVGGYDNANWGPAADVLYAFWPSARGDHPYLEAQFELQIIASNVITANDRYTFATESPTLRSQSIAKTDVEKINVFPNPYYAFNPEEKNRFDRFVTFNHLPQKATIRIFNLAGSQVRKIEKNSPSQFLKWDLKNESELPVASGLYIAHIDMPDIGETKVLKLFIVQSEQILEFY